MIFETSIIYYDEFNGSVNVNYQYDSSDIIYALNLPFKVVDKKLNFTIPSETAGDLISLFKENQISLDYQTVKMILSELAEPIVQHLYIRQGS